MAVAYSSSALLEPIRDLGVAWMNRGHAFMLKGDPASLAASLNAYHEAGKILRDLPVAENPSWANSLGAALMNYGQLLHRLHGTGRAPEALVSLDGADALLRAIPAGENPWPQRNLAGTLLNRANLLLDLGQFSPASTAAREALALVASRERSEIVEADLALKARRALCDALGQLLVAPGADQAALATEASDLVDDAFALIRHWASRGETAFQPLALRFFRYGTQLYRLHQPHFLAEFIRENLVTADAEFQAIALDVIDSALTDRPHDREFLTVGDPVSERELATGRGLASLRTSLAV